MKTEREKILLWTIRALMIVMIGGILNIIATNANNGKMPVLVDNISLIFPDSLHFGYTNFRNVSYPILTDIIHLPFLESYLSIGDLFLFIGLCLFVYLRVYYSGILRRDKKNE